MNIILYSYEYLLFRNPDIVAGMAKDKEIYTLAVYFRINIPFILKPCFSKILLFWQHIMVRRQKKKSALEASLSFLFTRRELMKEPLHLEIFPYKPLHNKLFG